MKFVTLKEAWHIYSSAGVFVFDLALMTSEFVTLKEAWHIYSSAGVFVFDLTLLTSEFVTEKSNLTLQRAVSSHHTNHWSHYTHAICKQLRKWNFFAQKYA
jgi:hypothetical protein